MNVSIKRIILVIVSVFTIIPLSIGQIFREDTPVSFARSLQTTIASHNLNVQFTKIQDNRRIEIIEDDTVEIFDPIIGELFDVSINRNNNGTWTEIDNVYSFANNRNNVLTFKNKERRKIE